MRSRLFVLPLAAFVLLSGVSTARADVVAGEEIVVGEEVVPPPPPPPVVMQEEDIYNRPGWSVGAGATFAIPAFQGGLNDLNFGDGWGFNVRGGYRFNEYFAIEGIYEYINEFQTDVGRRQGFDVSIWTNAFTVGPKLILPLGRFQPFLGGGVGFVNANLDIEERFERADLSFEDDNTQFAGRFGGGIDFFVTEHISLFADAAFTMATNDLDDLYYFSTGWGAKYNF